MKKAFVFAVLATSMAVRLVEGATLDASMTPASLVTSESLRWLSIGADFSQIKRDVTSRGGDASTLEARVYDGFVGIDVLDWLTVFGTAGICGVKESESDEYFSQGRKWSLGIAPSIWHMRIPSPEFMAGDLSIAGQVEYESYRSSEGGVSVDWSDVSAALLFRYRITEDSPWSEKEAMSLRFHVGPVVSRIKGDVSNPRESFTEDKSVGLLAGVELFITPQLSVAGAAEIFDEATLDGSLRFHF
jgi:hypothetical protein